MPAYYDMLISQSPPLFSHSPPTGFLSEYGPSRFYESPRFCRSAAVLTPPSARRFPPQLQHQPSLYQTTLQQNLTPHSAFVKCNTPKPMRSCLVARPANYKYEINDSDTESDDNDEQDDNKDTANDGDLEMTFDDDSTINSIASKKSTTKLNKDSQVRRTSRSKKRVVFADDRGLELEHIKIMSEPSTQPPTWSLQFLAHVTQGMISPVPQEQWTIDFRQPASDYLEFRRTLETKNVSLENVIIKEDESTVVGTVKVKNLSFHKEVFIRASWDEWKSHVDTYCTYQQIVGSSGAYVIYDTFSFKLTLPPHSRHLEFCVCFRADDKEYWDNNQGLNYILTNRISAQQQENELVMRLNNVNIQDHNTNVNTNGIQTTNINKSDKKQISSINKPRFGSWSEFSTRHNMESPLPYCSISNNNRICDGLKM